VKIASLLMLDKQGVFTP